MGPVDNTWTKYKLSDIMNVIGGGTPKTSNSEYWDGEIPWLSVKDFNSDSRTVFKTEKTITKLGFQNSSTKILNRGDIIISARGTVGALAQLGRPMAFNQSCYGLRSNSKTTNDFLYYLIKYKLNLLKVNTHGSVFDTITRNTFNLLEVEMPQNIDEQKAVSSILSDLDEKIELNNQINKNLEEMAQAIFKHWFIDFEFPNENGEPYKSSGGEMVESELGLIPKGWGVKELGEILSISNKTINPQKCQDMIFEHFSIPALDTNKLPILASGAVIKSNKFVINNECILISKLNPSTKRIWKPLCSTKNAICSTEFIVYKANNINYLDFGYSILDSDRFSEYLIQNASGSTNSRQRVSPKMTVEFKTIYPDEALIKKYLSIVSPMYKNIQINITANNNLSQIRDTLLPKLMSGEIRVPLDETS